MSKNPREATSKLYTVYVLWSATARCYYIGLSEDPDARLADHNAGVSLWTRGRGPWVIFWQREFPSLGEARKFENLLKRQKGGAGFFRHTGLLPQEWRGSWFLPAHQNSIVSRFFIELFPL